MPRKPRTSRTHWRGPKHPKPAPGASSIFINDTRAELEELTQKRNALKENLDTLDQQIYALEQSFFRKPSLINNFSKKDKRYKFSNAERIFSNTSVTAATAVNNFESENSQAKATNLVKQEASSSDQGKRTLKVTDSESALKSANRVSEDVQKGNSQATSKANRKRARASSATIEPVAESSSMASGRSRNKVGRRESISSQGETAKEMQSKAAVAKTSGGFRKIGVPKKKKVTGKAKRKSKRSSTTSSQTSKESVFEGYRSNQEIDSDTLTESSRETDSDTKVEGSSGRHTSSRSHYSSSICVTTDREFSNESTNDESFCGCYESNCEKCLDSSSG